MPRAHAPSSFVRLPALLVSILVAACSGGDDADPQQAGAPVDVSGAGAAGVAGVAGNAGAAGASGTGKGGAAGTGSAGTAGKSAAGAGGSGNGGSGAGGSGAGGSGNGGTAGSGKGGAGSGNGGSGNGGSGSAGSGNAGAAGKAGTGGVAGQGGGAGASSGAFQVIGYFPDWAGDVAAIQYDKVTQVNYAFALPTASGGLTGPDDVAKLDKLVKLAHAKGVKVAIAIGGWNDGNDSGFEQLSANAGARSAFVSKVKSFVTAHDLDGVDIDWEYPDPGASSQHYAALMKELSTELHGMGKLLSTAVVGEGGTGEGIPKEVFGYIDALNIMAYDGSTSEGHSPYAYASTCLSYWLGRGVPKQKAILGVPFYGRDPYVSYADLVKKDASAPTKDQVGNVHYNGIDTMKKKTALAAKSGGGIMIWELSQDTTGDTSLLSAIHAAAP